MGLLDKAGGTPSAPKAKPKAKAKPVAKAKAVAKAVEKTEQPVAAVAQPVVVEKKQKKAKKPRAARPTGLPEGFEISNKLDRTMSWFVNFGWNFGVLFAALFMMAGDTGLVTTILLLVSIVMIILNVALLPLKTGRNLGQFVARIKYVNYNGEKSNAFQGMLSNSVGILALFGLLFVVVSVSEMQEGNKSAGPIVWTSIGAIFLILYIVNWQFAKASQYNQGLYDVLFGAYLVKHVPTKEEKASGFWAKFESMGDYGDKFAARREAKMVARAQKEEEEKNASESEETTDESSSDSAKSDDKPKAKAKAKAKPKAKAKAKATKK